MPIPLEDIMDCATMANLSFSYGQVHGTNKRCTLLMLVFFQSAGMNLARVGPLPTVIVTILFGIVFFIFAVIVILTKVSERRLKLFSIIFWFFLVVQLYGTYAVQIHHTPSTTVCTTSIHYSSVIFLLFTTD